MIVRKTMTKTFCDLCGEEIKPCEDVCYKVKKEQYDMYAWGSHFWAKLECHEDCWKNLCAMLNDIKTKVDFKKLVDSFCTNDTERRLAELSQMSSDQFVRRINNWVEFPMPDSKVGYWIYEQGSSQHMCSNCRGTVGSHSAYFYCPWCGIKIDCAVEKEKFKEQEEHTDE